MATILLKGIARHPHVFQPSAPRGTTTRRYSVDLLVHKSDPAIQQALQAQEADKIATFPNGVPPKADMFISDLAQVQGTDPRLHDYYSVTFSTKEEQGQPEVVDMNYNKVLNPGQLQPGDVIWVNGNTSGYTVGDQGVKAYLNAVMVTGEKGVLPTELLSARPSAQQAFAGVPGAGGGQPAAAPPMQQPPVQQPPAAQQMMAPPPSPPPAQPQTQFQMTAAANGVTREQYHAAGWTDEQLIQNNLMLPPGGVNPSFM